MTRSRRQDIRALADEARITQSENLREWVTVIVRVFLLAPTNLQASDVVIDDLVQVVECRAREIAREKPGPVVSEQTLRELIAKWREDAAVVGNDFRYGGDGARIQAYTRCAAQLEALVNAQGCK